ncbi:MAG: 30S ribosomal protein S12 methylthiotransferase RimO [Armatimonadetes bacterium]|nr:30S ribosomal protein S12 methylthiotransferase RimO [Armatimonadota bacterium]MDW8122351.1 30S ribosomal protein S12 methylthiotransferase RimO [Armatimonadota bacterium]
MGKGIRCCLVSLGCPKNLVDTETVIARLLRWGFDITVHPQKADVIIVNTCGFLRAAVAESVKELKKLSQWRRSGRCRALLAIGCLVSRFPDLIREKVPEVDACLPSDQIGQVPAVVSNLLGRRPVRLPAEPPYPERVLSTPPWLAYLKIAEGCDRSCSFCTIPKIRGPQKSRSLDDLYKEACELVAAGVRELILIAQDTTLYGTDLYGRPDLSQLVKKLEFIPLLKWFRILYAYPTGVTDEVIEALASSTRFARYIDIPFQHSHRDILAAMRRGGDGERYLRLIERLRQGMPDIALRTTFIVGFPGETEHHFEDLLNFVQEAQIDHIGVFLFSAEEGTSAASLPNPVPLKVAKERRDRLMTLQQQISLQKNQRRVGQVVEAVLEGRKGHHQWSARSWFQAPDIDGHLIVTANGACTNGFQLALGRFVSVEIVKAKPYDLEARLLS